MSDEITSLDAQIQELLARKKSILDNQRDSELVKIKASIAQFSFTASDLGFISSTKAKKASNKTTLEPKYVNPSNSNETWHGGRGAKPKWVKAFLANGEKLEDIVIK